MQKAERVAAPALGIALGYFIAMYATHSTDWLPEDKQAETVAMAGGVCTYVIQELRAFARWVVSQAMLLRLGRGN